MYIILECATCVVLILVAATLLFGSCVALLMIQEGGLLLEGLVRGLIGQGEACYELGNTADSTGQIRGIK